MATHGSAQHDLEWYYRETETIDGSENVAAERCGVTPDEDMNMHWKLTCNGAQRTAAQPQSFARRYEDELPQGPAPSR